MPRLVPPDLHSAFVLINLYFVLPESGMYDYDIVIVKMYCELGLREYGCCDLWGSHVQWMWCATTLRLCKCGQCSYYYECTLARVLVLPVVPVPYNMVGRQFDRVVRARITTIGYNLITVRVRCHST